MSTAVVVGSGPNGLAAAIILARAGSDVTVLEAADEIGGGTRTGEAIVPGLLHDHCSAIHPMAVGSPFLRELDLTRYGLSWAWPEIDCAHPLDDGTAGVLLRSVGETAAGLGSDGRAWRLLFERTAAGYERMSGDIMRPLLRLPRHPISLARFGIPALAPAALLAGLFRTEQARGCSAASRLMRFIRCIDRSALVSAWASSPPATPTVGRSPPVDRDESPKPWRRPSVTWAGRSKRAFACGRCPICRRRM